MYLHEREQDKCEQDIVINGALNWPWKAPLTDKKIRYRQIQKVVIALSSQTLVHFKGQNDQRVAQNYHNH